MAHSRFVYATIDYNNTNSLSLDYVPDAGFSDDFYIQETLCCNRVRPIQRRPEERPEQSLERAVDSLSRPQLEGISYYLCSLQIQFVCVRQTDAFNDK